MERERGLAERTIAAIDAGETGDYGERIFERWHGAGWFSREILACIDRIDRAQDLGEFERACRASAELGELTTALRMKRAFDPDVETGIKIRDTLEVRRNAANEAKRDAAKRRHAQWQKEADRIWSERPRLSKPAVAAAIKSKLQESAKEGTIRKAIRKLASPG